MVWILGVVSVDDGHYDDVEVDVVEDDTGHSDARNRRYLILSFLRFFFAGGRTGRRVSLFVSVRVIT